jgi:hypothetical protein
MTGLETNVVVERGHERHPRVIQTRLVPEMAPATHAAQQVSARSGAVRGRRGASGAQAWRC